jgi:formylglycine-generating enzyme required for sulfatase activity
MSAMMLIPGGDVSTGSPADHLDTVAGQQHFGREWFEDESPLHTRKVEPFRLACVPVTNREFAAFTNDTGHLTGAERRGFGMVYGAEYWEKQPGVCWHHPAAGLDAVSERSDHPVIHVDHADAAAYAGWAGMRLPTEAEWEYAAHGPAWQAWPWGNEWDSRAANTAEYWAGGPVRDFADWKAWWAHRHARHGSAPSTTTVGLFSPRGDSPFGVMDMAGNVAEWTATTYHPYDPGRSYDEGFQAAMRLGYVVVRGGSWKHFRFQARTSERIACNTGYSSFDVGFRIACGPEQC